MSEVNWRRKVRSTLDTVRVPSPVASFTRHRVTYHVHVGRAAVARAVIIAVLLTWSTLQKIKLLLWRNFIFFLVQGQQPEGKTGCRGSDIDKVHKIRKIVFRNNNYEPSSKSWSMQWSLSWHCFFFYWLWQELKTLIFVC